MKVVHIVGARPNFVKAAAVIQALAARGSFEQGLIHSGQHFDPNMSERLFVQLGLPKPDVHLSVTAGDPVQQISEIIEGLNGALPPMRPDITVLYGDVNTTLAAAIVCSRHGLPTAHVESGLRSFDRAMPEEINRIVADHLCDTLLAPSIDAVSNLRREGVRERSINLVGNVMIDSLVRLLPLARPPEGIPLRFILVTLHRPSNVDDLGMLREIIKGLTAICRDIPILFPVHPRTRRRLQQLGLGCGQPDHALRFLPPLGYLEFLALEQRATLVVTDSGGVQQETTYLRVPCLTLRENTEWTDTVTLGTNIVVGRNMARLRAELERVLQGDRPAGSALPLWDGKSGERIADVLETVYVRSGDAPQRQLQF